MMAFRTFLEFQSTPSVWRETYDDKLSALFQTDFNPLPPYGGRPLQAIRRTSAARISIHSLRMEGDLLILVWDAI